jgi:Domain of unknown function (DUF1918)
MEATIGDHFVVKRRKVGQPRRKGEVVAVLGPLFSRRQHFRVRWDDGHESVYVPGAAVRVERKSGAG